MHELVVYILLRGYDLKRKLLLYDEIRLFFGGISIDTKTSQNCDHSLSYDRNDTEVIS